MPEEIVEREIGRPRRKSLPGEITSAVMAAKERKRANRIRRGDRLAAKAAGLKISVAQVRGLEQREANEIAGRAAEEAAAMMRRSRERQERYGSRWW